MKGLNLSKFKKHSSDVNTTTLVHPDGHEIKIAHKSLKGELKKQIDALPHYEEGGFIENAVKTVSNAFSEPAEAKRKQDYKENTEASKKKRQTDINNNYAEGGEVTPPYLSGQPMLNQIDPNMGLQPQDFELSANRLPAENLQQPAESATAGWLHGAPSSQPVDTTLGGRFQAPAQQPQEQFQNVQIPQAAAQQPNTIGPMDPTKVMQEGIGQTQQGIMGEAKAAGDLGKQQAVQYAEQAQKAQDLEANYNSHFQALESERAKIADDIRNGHIDPQHYINSMSDMGKVSTAIGMILGGLGGSTAPVEFLNKQIDRDIESQKATMNMKHNLLSATMQQFGNLKDATAMTKALYADIYSNKIAEAAARSTDPMAKAKAQQAIGELKLKYGPEMAQIALKQAVFKGQQSGSVSSEQAVNFLVPKEHQAKALEEIKDMQVTQRAVTDVTKAMQDVSKLQSSSNRLLSPIQSKSQINAINTKIDTLAKELFGRVTDNEIEILTNNKVGFTDNSQTIQKKIQNLQQMLQKQAFTPTLKAYGITPPVIKASSAMPNKNVSGAYARPNK